MAQNGCGAGNNIGLQQPIIRLPQCCNPVVLLFVSAYNQPAAAWQSELTSNHQQQDIRRHDSFVFFVVFLYARTQDWVCQDAATCWTGIIVDAELVRQFHLWSPVAAAEGIKLFPVNKAVTFSLCRFQVLGAER